MRASESSNPKPSAPLATLQISFHLLALILFLIALPLPALDGSGRGFLASPNPFPGFVMVLFGLLLPLSGWYGLPWLLILASNAITWLAPFTFALPGSPQSRERNIILTSFAATLQLLSIPTLYASWPDGCLIGAHIWSAATFSSSIALILFLIRLHRAPNAPVPDVLEK